MLHLRRAMLMGLATLAWVAVGRAELVYVDNDSAADWPGAASVRTSVFETAPSRGVRGDRVQAQSFQVGAAFNLETILIAYEWMNNFANPTMVRIVEVDDVFAATYVPGDEVAAAAAFVTGDEPASMHPNDSYALELTWDDSVDGPLTLSPRTGNQGYAVEITGTGIGNGSSPIALMYRGSAVGLGGPYPLGRAYELINGSPSGPFTADFDFMMVLSGPPAVPPVMPDLNMDGKVDIFDVAIVSNNWGGAGPDGDANKDGVVDIFDVALISNNWNPGGEASAVPEPSVAWLLFCAAAVWPCRAPRHVTNRATS